MTDVQPRLDFVAAQLRKPSGSFATTIAQNMDKANEPLSDLTLQSMNLQGDEQILEIGFGSGRFMHKLFSRHSQPTLTGVDYSPEMVELAATMNRELITSGRVTLKEGSSEQLPLEDETFDVVFSNMVIYFWDNPDSHLREVWRVLKPGGKFYTGFRSRKSMMQMPFVQFGFTLYDPGEWQAVLERIGFKVLRTDRKVDPEMDVNGRRLQLESICMAAQKQA